MAPRRRKEINRPLPNGLRVREGYYSWRNPEDGIEYGLGRHRRHAISEAINRHLIHQTERAKGATLGKKMHVDKITRVFKSELAELGIYWSGKEPVFHGERLLPRQTNRIFM